ncbi:hypothetical protein BDW72DRAFT_172022 [Aspergillus terricola var. indicus]
MTRAPHRASSLCRCPLSVLLGSIAHPDSSLGASTHAVDKILTDQPHKLSLFLPLPRGSSSVREDGRLGNA